jgi:hypothetical protein
MAWPQFLQNLAPCRFGSPQFGQAFSSRVPHWSQNAALTEFSDWQRGQIMERLRFDEHIVRAAFESKPQFFGIFRCGRKGPDSLNRSGLYNVAMEQPECRWAAVSSPD